MSPHPGIQALKHIVAAMAATLACSCFACVLLVMTPKCALADDFSSLRERAAILESNIAVLEGERDALEVELKDIASTLEDVEIQMQDYRDSESANRCAASESVVSLYKIETSPFMLIDSVLDAGSLSDAIKRIEYFDLVRNSCVKNINEIKEALEGLDQQKAELSERQATAESDLADKASQIAQDQAELEAVRQKIADNPGRRIAAAAVALAGCKTKNNTAPGPASYYGKTAHTTENARVAPPRTCEQGDWSIYLDVYSKISNGNNVPNHACCDCLPVLAVLWSGVDDGYLNGKYPYLASEFNYLANSPKWDRVGGEDAYWYRNPSKGTANVELQPGDIMVTINPSKNKRHWMVYVGHDIAANRWGEDTFVDCVDEAYCSRWANGKPLSARKEEKWMVFRRNTKDYNPNSSRWNDFMKDEKERYL